MSARGPYKAAGIHVYVHNYRKKNGDIVERVSYYEADGNGNGGIVGRAYAERAINNGTPQYVTRTADREYDPYKPRKEYGTMIGVGAARRRTTDLDVIETKSRGRAYALSASVIPKRELAAVARRHGVGAATVSSIIRDADHLMYKELDEYAASDRKGGYVGKNYNYPKKKEQQQFETFNRTLDVSRGVSDRARGRRAAHDNYGRPGQFREGGRDYRASSILGPGMA